MTTSELITPTHQARKALIYVRQSTPQQVLSNQESLRLQYALQQRAVDLGWRPSDIDVIDADLGQTGAEAQHREGFKDLIARVTLGQVGLILSTEVTRLSRNCSDWYPLLDLCGFKECLIADRDGVYDPGSANGRFLLGLKGQLSEMELHSIRGRLTAGLLNKAQRGELALALPMGLVRQLDGAVVKDPNQEIQDRLSLVFTTFLRVQSASQVLRFFNAQDLTLPRRDRLGELVWVKPSIAALVSILKNPAYAGAFVYGRTRTVHTATGKTSLHHLPLGQWTIMIPDKYPTYLRWETFQQIQAKLQDNYAEYDRNGSRGVPRPGAALLHGLVYCGACGHKMVVQYKGGTLYLCIYLRQQFGVPVCQYIPANALDQAVVQAFFRVLSPAELAVYDQALAAREATAQTTRHAQEQQLTRLRYEVALAQRQYNQVDPDNRLVAAELERRWEVALVALKQAEDALAQPQLETNRPRALPPELKAALVALGQKLPDLWAQPILSTKTKKALLRCLIDKVVVHRATPDCLEARIVWKGGDTTPLRIPIPVGAWVDLSTAGEMETIILELSAQGQSDADIAQHLTALGHRSPMNTQGVLPSTVRGIRLKHHRFQTRSQSHPRYIAGRLTVPQVARSLEVSVHWIYDRIHNGTIHLAKDVHTGLYLFPDNPETLALLRDLQVGELKDLRF